MDDWISSGDPRRLRQYSDQELADWLRAWKYDLDGVRQAHAHQPASFWEQNDFRANWARELTAHIAAGRKEQARRKRAREKLKLPVVRLPRRK